MNKLLIAMLGMALAGVAGAKLPAATPEAQAKAEEAKQKTAWTDKVAAFQLCKAQDKVAGDYRQKKGNVAPAVAPAAAPAAVAPVPATAVPAVLPVTAAATTAAATPAATTPATTSATTPATTASATVAPTPATTAATTPVVAAAPAAIPACKDPGPYVAAVADATKVGVADSLPVPAAGKPLTPAEAKK